LVPGVLWWAVDPETASGLPSTGGIDRRRWADHYDNGTVLLLDEIDKAEPDLPNDLLGPLNNLEITLPKFGVRSPLSDVLVVITSNGERDMPPAFLRRCVSLQLKDQGLDFFRAVATSHFGARNDGLYDAVARRTLEVQALAEREARRIPSTAEYLDTVRACIDFGERPGSPLWNAIEEASLRKTRGNEEQSSDA
jgi:MoxR-like ATPase